MICKKIRVTCAVLVLGNLQQEDNLVVIVLIQQILYPCIYFYSASADKYENVGKNYRHT